MKNNRVSLNDKMKTQAGTESYFKKTQPQANESNEKEKKVDEELIRKTYYMTDTIVKALALMSVTDDRNISEIVRDILEKNIPQNFIDEAKKLLNK